MINYSIVFFINYSSNELTPQLADTSQPHLVNVTPFPPHYPQQIPGNLLLGIIPLNRWVQTRHFEPLSCHLAPHLFVFDKLSH
jgi:hypothetical protein